MKMNRWYVGIMAVMLPAGVWAQSIWTDDHPAALETAKAENRFVLMNFTGSDWCGWCIKLDKEVFSQSAFKQYARENLVCVEVDFPMKKKLSPKLQKQNAALQSKYGIRGYPSIVLLDPNGEKIAQTGYKPGGAKEYVSHLRGLIGPHAEKFGPVSAAEAPAPAPAGNPDTRTLRTWTSASGSTVEARYEQRRGNHVELRREDGTLVRIDLPSLSEADHAFLRSIKAIQ